MSISDLPERYRKRTDIPSDPIFEVIYYHNDLTRIFLPFFLFFAASQAVGLATSGHFPGKMSRSEEFSRFVDSDLEKWLEIRSSYL